MSIGISFPWVNGVPTWTTDEDVQVFDAISDIVKTPRGDRLNRPEYGCDAVRFVFESRTTLLYAKTRHETKRAIEANEPRVTVLKIDVYKDTSIPDGGVDVNVYYEFLGRTNRVDVVS